ncbi:MAG: hypothetical protein HYZ53_20920 [Planctomycetes bacterium]|nr:hypothetical protein [Planctomycetota bacterium]
MARKYVPAWEERRAEYDAAGLLTTWDLTGDWRHEGGRGWSRGMVQRLLGEPDGCGLNAVPQGGMTTLDARARVEATEATPEFRRAAARVAKMRALGPVIAAKMREREAIQSTFARTERSAGVIL